MSAQQGGNDSDEGVPWTPPPPMPPPMPRHPPMAADRSTSDMNRVRLDLSSVELRSPLWRVLAVAAFVAAFVAGGMYLAEQGSAESVALIAVVALAKISGYWSAHLARLRPPTKPGVHVPTELRNLSEALRRWLHARPIIVCCLFGVVWGVVTLIAKNLMTGFFEQLYSPMLSIAVGCAVGAVIAAPEFFKSGARKLGWTKD